MQNDRGGYENDCILVRESDCKLVPIKLNFFFVLLVHNYNFLFSYLLVSPTSQQTKSFHWMRRHLPNDGSIDMKDVTSMYSVINVVGPKAKQILSELSQSDVNLQPFTCKVCSFVM